ncbi:MAG: S8 family peptidase [Bacteroidales bacterium]|nr:S8 family peptidase [Bacteroidales bacterium]
MKKSILFLLLTLFSLNLIYAQNLNAIEPELQEVLNQKGDEMISITIILKSQADVQKLQQIAAKATDRKTKRETVVNELKSFSKHTQSDIMSILDAESKSGNVDDVRCHWLVNAISCNASSDIIYRIARHADVEVIAYDEMKYLLWDEEVKAVESTRGMTQNITHVKADEVWNLGYTGQGVTVAVIDTGVNFNHIDLADHLWDGGDEYPNHGYNTLENSHDVSDGFGHGTHCAGVVCGDGTSGTQTGIAPNATLMCIKVMDDTGYGNATSISAGMEFAIEHGADVLNMSLGIPFASSAVREMLRGACVNALECGIAAAVAVGNDGQLQISFPVPNNVRVPGGCPPPWIHPDQESNAGGLSCCIAVGAVDFNNVRAAFSSYGPFTWQETAYADYPYNPGMGLIRPDISAPGVGIVSASPNNNNGHVTMEGTSQAAPCVAGVIALMLEKNPEISPAEISMILETTAVKIEDNKNNYTGSGCINALAAVQSIEGGEVVDPCDAPTNLNAAVEQDAEGYEYVFKTTLTWNEVADAISYNVYVNGELYETVTTISSVYGTDEEGTLNIAVSTKCQNGESDMSESISVVLEKEVMPCDAPINLNATIEQDAEGYDYNFKVTMTWDAVDNASQYVVYLDGIILDVTSVNSYVKGFDEEGTHSFAVVSICVEGEFEMSEAFEFELVGESIEEYENKFEIYPNPVDDVLCIKSDNIIKEVNVYNIVGIKMATVSSQQSTVNIDMSAFNSGVYFVEVDGKIFRVIRN